MHEVSLATKVVAAGVQEARRRGLHQARSLHLRLGALWGVEPTPFAFQVAVVAQGTALEKANLALEIIPAVARCRSCGIEVRDPRLDDPGFLHNLAHASILLEALLSCSGCGASAVAIEQGRELEVVAVEG